MTRENAPRARRSLERRIEIATVVLLALATISSAWCVYQATRWGGEQTVQYSQANALRQESVRANDLALAQEQVDVQIFLQWVSAVSQNSTAQANFLQERFRSEFKPAFNAWLAQGGNGTTGQIPPGTPFDRPEYQLASEIESLNLLQNATDAAQNAQKANQIGDNFVLATVLFASVLFLVGVESRLREGRMKVWIIFLAAGVFIMAASIMFFLPQNVGF